MLKGHLLLSNIHIEVEASIFVSSFSVYLFNGLILTKGTHARTKKSMSQFPSYPRSCAVHSKQWCIVVQSGQSGSSFVKKKQVQSSTV